MTKYLELTTKFLQYYIMLMLTVCAILLSIIVYNTSGNGVKIKSLTDQLSRLELIEYVEK